MNIQLRVSSSQTAPRNHVVALPRSPHRVSGLTTNTLSILDHTTEQNGFAPACFTTLLSFFTSPRV